MQRSIIAGLIGMLAIAAVVAFSTLNKPGVTGVTGEQASAAAIEALRYAGGERATLMMSTEPGVVLKFHVVRPDGSTTDVRIGEDLHVIEPERPDGSS